MSDLESIREKSSFHKDAVLRSAQCGCYSCLRLYPPSEIKEWVRSDASEAEKTAKTCAVCPHCSADSVLPGSEVDLSESLLKAMRHRYFSLSADRRYPNRHGVIAFEGQVVVQPTRHFVPEENEIRLKPREAVELAGWLVEVAAFAGESEGPAVLEDMRAAFRERRGEPSPELSRTEIVVLLAETEMALSELGIHINPRSKVPPEKVPALLRVAELASVCRLYFRVRRVVPHQRLVELGQAIHRAELEFRQVGDPRT